jgi:hypothetical protein
VKTAAESIPSVTTTSLIDTDRPPVDCAEALGTIALSKLTAVQDARSVETAALRARCGKRLIENMKVVSFLSFFRGCSVRAAASAHFPPDALKKH